MTKIKLKNESEGCDMAEIKLLKNKYELKAGNSVTIVAFFTGWVPRGKEKPPKILFGVEGEGSINDKGVFTSKESDADRVVKIIVMTTDPTISTKEVFVEIKALKRLVIRPRHLSLLSGQIKKFNVESKFNVDVKWSIKDQDHNSGTIDCEGNYKAPEIILKDRNITIVGTDLNTGKTDEVEISLLALRLSVRDNSNRQIVNAGAGKTALDIKAENNPVGIDNFKCTTVHPFLGRIEGRFYYPPARTDGKSYVLKIIVESGLSDKIKAEHFILLKNSICKESGCDGEIGIKGYCMKCNQPATSGALAGGKK